jgi:hemoglobin-like flavoprotein
MDARQLYLVRNSLDWFSPCGPALIARVIQRVRERDPSSAEVLGPGGEAQNKQLFATLRQIVRGMSDFHKLEAALLESGKALAQRGGHATLYAIVRDEIITTMAQLAGDDWSNDLTNAWSEVLNTVSGTLLRAGFEHREAA